MMLTAPLRLDDDAHLCAAGGGFVVLDLKADRYVGLTGPAAEALRAALDGAKPGPTAALEPLIEAGTLTRSTARGRPLLATVRPPPERRLADEPAPAGRIDAGRAARFFCAATGARHALRRRPILETVLRVGRRRAAGGAPADLAKAADLTAAFLRMRPLYPLDRRCLFDSLALIEFLACYGVHPTWVFGVRLDPWRAHCWVEHDGVLFNDELEETAQYTPILAA